MDTQDNPDLRPAQKVAYIGHELVQKFLKGLLADEGAEPKLDGLADPYFSLILAGRSGQAITATNNKVNLRPYKGEHGQRFRFETRTDGYVRIRALEAKRSRAGPLDPEEEGCLYVDNDSAKVLFRMKPANDSGEYFKLQVVVSEQPGEPKSLLLWSKTAAKWLVRVKGENLSATGPSLKQATQFLYLQEQGCGISPVHIAEAKHEVRTTVGLEMDAELASLKEQLNREAQAALDKKLNGLRNMMEKKLKTEMEAMVKDLSTELQKDREDKARMELRRQKEVDAMMQDLEEKLIQEQENKAMMKEELKDLKSKIDQEEQDKAAMEAKIDHLEETMQSLLGRLAGLDQKETELQEREFVIQQKEKELDSYWEVIIPGYRPQKVKGQTIEAALRFLKSQREFDSDALVWNGEKHFAGEIPSDILEGRVTVYAFVRNQVIEEQFEFWKRQYDGLILENGSGFGDYNEWCRKGRKKGSGLFKYVYEKVHPK